MNNKKIYIINGYLYESGDEYTWVEEVFKDKEQAEACCTYLNIVHAKNPSFEMSEHEISTCNYIDLLEERKEWVKELSEAEEKMHY